MKTLFALLLAGIAAAALAQQQAKPQQQQLDKETMERLRTEGATGGTRPPTEREKEGAAVGAGPHREFNPGGESRERHEQNAPRSSEDEKSLQSGDARPGADRP